MLYCERSLGRIEIASPFWRPVVTSTNDAHSWQRFLSRDRVHILPPHSMCNSVYDLSNNPKEGCTCLVHKNFCPRCLTFCTSHTSLKNPTRSQSRTARFPCQAINQVWQQRNDLWTKMTLYLHNFPFVRRLSKQSRVVRNIFSHANP